ncbi:MAG: DUF504 domain-containing protein [Nanoarchaeota archaeon]|nr:DUF504 domain-containing protein [Nanoarchaeota archaeon]
MAPIEELMRMKWDPNYKSLKSVKIIVKHRGAPNNEKVIFGENITKIQKDGFWYVNNLGEEVFIPAHRILDVQDV